MTRENEREIEDKFDKKSRCMITTVKTVNDVDRDKCIKLCKEGGDKCDAFTYNNNKCQLYGLGKEESVTCYRYK